MNVLTGTRYTWPVRLFFDNNLWNGERSGGCYGLHGRAATHWPWWKQFGVNLVTPRFDPSSPCSGRTLWVYTRFGAVDWMIIVDRRNLR